ncbi:MAG: VOC family protein [Pirellulaceae bacterium]|nr:VOC family protein [Pirellulaceae bacterium]
MKLQPFHLAVGVHDLVAAREFYGGLLGCTEGRSSQRWVDFNFFGHQFVVHVDDTKDGCDSAVDASNAVDGHAVPVPHFGVVLQWPTWQCLADKLKSANVEFVIEPYIRFEGEVGEQATMFLYDPSGNALEFKAFKDESQLFAI